MDGQDLDLLRVQNGCVTKYNEVKNNLQTLKKQGIIAPDGKTWKMSKPVNNPK